jgi:hypothetical protein
MVVIRGRLEPEVGAVVMQALTAAREALYRRRETKNVPAGTSSAPVPAGTSVVDGSAEPPTMEQQQADALALVVETASPWNGSRRPGRALSGGGPRRRASAGRCRGAGPVGARGRRARSRGNVSAPGVRRQPRGDATRCRWPNHGGWRPYTDDPAGAEARASASRRRLSLSRLQSTVRPRASHPPLGARRPHEAVESRDAVSAAPPCGPRRGFPGRATGRRRAMLPAAGRTSAPADSAAGRGAHGTS